MKRRFPLYAKILVWFFLNLLLLGIAAVVVFSGRGGVDAVLVRYAGDRIREVSRGITVELGQRPSSEWDGVLQRYSEVYGVNFLLFRLDGTQLAGEPTVLPKEVQEMLSNRGEVLRLMFGEDVSKNISHNVGEGGLPFGSNIESRPFPRQRPRFLVRTSNPTRYWVALPAGLRGQTEGPREPSVLLIESHSLYGGGLFLDITPLIVAVSGVALFSVLFWLPLIRGITRSIRQTTRATEQIAAGRFDVRVPAQRRDELGQLGEAVNIMTERLEGFVTGQRRFLGDIAHELCSPIARAQVAVSLLEQRSNEPGRIYVRDLREEIEHMSGLVGELLSFSKASLGKTAVKLQPVNVRQVIERAVERETQLGADIRLAMESGLTAAADPELLQRALANLLRNAVRYAGNAGPITVSGCRDDDSALITVTDCGPGVPEESLQRLFDPFYRVDNSRTRETGGVGLGLTIAKTCVEACRGSVVCRNGNPSGFEVLVRLSAISDHD
jgi:two-component system, OmpR family, sensor histidine kinase CpxA